jgi:hypothetical protein
MVCYVYDCNYVKAIPMRSRFSSEWVKAYDTVHQELTVKGFKQKLETLDNEVSTALKNFSTADVVEYQLVPPHCYLRNAAERAIQTFKGHFVAGLSSVDPTITLHLWDRLFTTGGNHIESPADLETPPTIIRRSSLSWPRGLQQNRLCSARTQDYCTQETRKATHLGAPRATWLFLGSRYASLPMSECIHLVHG